MKTASLLAATILYKTKVAYTLSSAVCVFGGITNQSQGVIMAILEFAILLVVVLGLAYISVQIWIWTLVIAAGLLLLSFFGDLSVLALALCWIIFIPAALFALLKTQRQKYFIIPIVKKLQSHIPAMSQTEQDAIDAGDVWWEKELFCGRPKWKNLLSIPAPALTAEEQSFVDNEVDTVCSMIDDYKVVMQDGDISPEVWEYLKKERFFGMVLPKEYGGRGFSALAHSTVVMKMATHCITAAVNTMVPNSLGPGELLVHYGTDEQKKYYLPRLTAGLEMPCFALTSPTAGSDAGSITDHGTVCRGTFDGKEVIGIKLTWEKRYITLAPVANVFGLAFRLFDPEHLLGDKDEIGITCGLIPTSTPGVEIGHRHNPMHIPFMNGPTRGKDVFVPLDIIIGGVKMAGQGWKMLMESLSVGRSISLPALSTASAKLCYRATGAYARVRTQFNTSIANFEGVEESLAQIAGLTYTLESCRIMTAGAVDLGITPSIASAIAKYHMTEMSRIVINNAMDVNAGHAIQTGPRNFLSNPYMAVPVSITVEGANILTRNLIIFGQGAIRCHPYILREMKLFPKNDPKSESELDSILVSHMGFVISNIVRNIICGWTGGLLLFSPVRGPTARYYRQLSRMSAALALLADCSMLLLGGALKRKERISARLGDILSQLYIASSVMKYFQDNKQPASDLDNVRWSIENCLFQIQIAIDDVTENFPMRWIGKLLYFLVFPFGRAYRKPSDKLCHEIVTTMSIPSEFRDRLTRYFFYSKDPNDPEKRLDIALQKRIEMEPLLKKFNNLIRNKTVAAHLPVPDALKLALKGGSLTQEETDALLDYNKLVGEVIKVDEFSHDLSEVLTDEVISKG
jgi:acyl-CoA dehydrogenase